jgi:hypothetical protein
MSRDTIVFGSGRLEKSLTLIITASTLSVALSHPGNLTDLFFCAVGLFSAAYTLYVVFSFRLTVGDGYIVCRWFGKFQAISFDDIVSWRVRYTLEPLGTYTVESKSGTNLRFPSSVQRPRELERILDDLVFQATESEQPIRN